MSSFDHPLRLKLFSRIRIFAAYLLGVNDLRLINTPSDYELAVLPLRVLDPELPDFAWSVISRFRPRLETPHQWATIREFVIRVVLHARPRQFDTTRRLMTMVTRYTAWVWATTGAELIPEKIFTPHLLRRFVEQGLNHHSDAYRFDMTRHVGSLVESLTGKPATRRTLTKGASNLSVYTSKELARFCSWALSRNTDRRRHNAYSILAMCGGAGLSSAELIEVRIEDITSSGPNRFIHVRGTHPRTVPIWMVWHHTVDRAIDNRTSGFLFRGNRSEEYPPRLVQSFLSENTWELRPSPARLRLTWIVKQLEQNLPLPVLLEIAGFSDAAALNTYLQHLKPANVNDYLRQITGEEDSR